MYVAYEAYYSGTLHGPWFSGLNVGASVLRSISVGCRGSGVYLRCCDSCWSHDEKLMKEARLIGWWRGWVERRLLAKRCATFGAAWFSDRCHYYSVAVGLGTYFGVCRMEW